MNSPFDGAITWYVNITSFKLGADPGKFLACAKSLIESWPENRLRFFFSVDTRFF